jgi:hypothetical protein
MERAAFTGTTLAFVVLAAAVMPAVAIDEIPEKRPVEKGGVYYPHVGDSSQERFQTPSNVKEILRPGMVIGIPPADCVTASSGALGEYYRCDHGLQLKPMEYDGKTVYQVLEYR